MSPDDIAIRTVDVKVFDIRGKLTDNPSDTFLGALQKHFDLGTADARKTPHFLVNLAGVTELDNSGIHALKLGYVTFGGVGKYKLLVPSKEMRDRLTAASGWDTRIEIFDNELEALTSFQ